MRPLSRAEGLGEYIGAGTVQDANLRRELQRLAPVSSAFHDPVRSNAVAPVMAALSMAEQRYAVLRRHLKGDEVKAKCESVAQASSDLGEAIDTILDRRRSWSL